MEKFCSNPKCRQYKDCHPRTNSMREFDKDGEELVVYRKVFAFYDNIGATKTIYLCETCAGVMDIFMRLHANGSDT